MLFALWSPKGGSGTSVVAAGLASYLARRRPVALVDLAGDLPAVAGLPPGRGSPTLLQWLAAGPTAPSEALDDLFRPLAEGFGLIPLGGPAAALAGLPAESGAALAAALAAGPDVVVDAGRAEHGVQRAVVEVADAAVVVTRACYLALRRAVDDELTARAAGVVLVAEPGRSLDPRDVADVLGCEVMAVVRTDPAIARAVDAGMLVHHPPAVLDRRMAALALALHGRRRRAA